MSGETGANQARGWEGPSKRRRHRSAAALTCDHFISFDREGQDTAVTHPELLDKRDHTAFSIRLFLDSPAKEVAAIKRVCQRVSGGKRWVRDIHWLSGGKGRQWVICGVRGPGPSCLGPPKVCRNASEGRRNSETKLAGVSVCACDGVDIKTETKPDVVFLGVSSASPLVVVPFF